MKASPQALAGAVALILALVVATPVVLGSGRAWPTPLSREDLSLPLPAESEPRSTAAALDPIVATAAGPRLRNPFNLRPEATRVRTELPLPPPPALRLPEPILLPVQGEVEP